MTQVDFYILASESDDLRLDTACRIVEKAVQRNQHVYVNSASETEARKLDERLWTFSDGSFIPHRLLRSADEAPGPEPVLIGCGALAPPTPLDVMINLDLTVPEFFSRYERVAEVVDSRRDRREQGRERFRYYRDRGYPPAVHRL